MQMEDTKEEEAKKKFDLKVSFLVIRENERVDLVIEYFNEKLKKMSKEQLSSGYSQFNSEPGAEYQNNDAISAQNLEKDIEKDFVFNFRTFKEVFPYISTVSVADHSCIEEAYHE